MSFIQKNKFWIGIALSMVVLTVLYLVLVAPKRRQVKRNVVILEDDLNTLEVLQTKGRRIATDEKIRECKKVVEILRKQYDDALNYFPSREEERLDYWQDVIDPRTKKIQGALFKEKYEDEGLALEKRLRKEHGIEVSDGVFEWINFGEDVPQHEDCVPAMKDFRILEHISGLIIDSKAVTHLNSVKLGKEETLVFNVGEEAFYSRPLEISASVLYSRLLFLVEKLHKSPKNIIVDTILIKQVAVAMAKGGQEPPVAVTMVCGMLQRGRKTNGE